MPPSSGTGLWSARIGVKVADQLGPTPRWCTIAVHPAQASVVGAMVAVPVLVVVLLVVVLLVVMEEVVEEVMEEVVVV